MSILIALLSIGVLEIGTRCFFPGLAFSIKESFIEYLYRVNMRKNINAGKIQDIIIIDINFESCKLNKSRMPNHKEIAEALCLLSKLRPSCIFLDLSMDFKEPDSIDIYAGNILSAVNNLGLAGVFVPNREGGDLLDINLNPIDRFNLPYLNYAEGICKMDDNHYAEFPLSSFMSSCRFFGFLNVFYDQQGRVTHIPIAYQYKEKIYPSAILSMYSLLKGFSLDSVMLKAKYLQIRDQKVPLENGCFRFMPQGPEGTFTLVPFFKLNALREEHIKNKVVFIGRSLGIQDKHAIKSGRLIFGTEILANALYCLLHEKYTRIVSEWIIYLIAILNSLVICILALQKRLNLAIMWVAISIILVMVLSVFAVHHGYLFNPYIIISASIISLLLCCAFIYNFSDEAIPHKKAQNK